MAPSPSVADLRGRVLRHEQLTTRMTRGSEKRFEAALDNVSVIKTSLWSG